MKMARRCLVVSNKLGTDEKTKDTLLYLAAYRLPTKRKDGGLWYPKPTEAVINVCVNKTRDPEKFNRLSTIQLGSLVDIEFGFNEFTDKSFVSSVELVPNTSFLKDEVLYL